MTIASSVKTHHAEATDRSFFFERVCSAFESKVEDLEIVYLLYLYSLYLSIASFVFLYKQQSV